MTLHQIKSVVISNTFCYNPIVLENAGKPPPTVGSNTSFLVKSTL